MKKFALLVVLALAIAPALMAASVVASKHDLRSSNSGAITGQTEVCVSCHTPHQPTGQTTDPLWNHTLATTASYGVYASGTLQATPAEVGGGSTATNLCLSCHDGSVAVGSQYNPQNGVTLGYTAAGNVNGTGFMTGNPLVGTDLTNDHPVNFTYNAALVTADTTANGGVAGLVDPTTAPVAALLSGGMVQCSSCHDAHDPQYGSFLVKSNAASALCTTCHIK